MLPKCKNHSLYHNMKERYLIQKKFRILKHYVENQICVDKYNHNPYRSASRFSRISERDIDLPDFRTP